MFPASLFFYVAQLPLQYCLEASLSVGLVDRNRRFLFATQLKTNFHFLGRFQDTLELLLQQQPRVEQLQEPTLAGPYYFWCAHTYNYMGDQERAAESEQGQGNTGER